MNFVESTISSCISGTAAGATSFFFAGAYSQAISISDSGFLDLWQASASLTVHQAASMQQNQSYFVGASTCNFSTGFLELYPLFEQAPSPQFSQAVNVLLLPNPEFLDSISNWNKFFSYWGTGLPTAVRLGGTGAVFFATNQSTFQEQGQAWVEAQGNLNIGWFVNSAGGSVSGSVSEASSLFLNNTI